MEIRASQKSVAIGQDLPNSPPDRLSSIKTTTAQNSSPTLSPQSSTSLNDSPNQAKALSNETLQKLTSNPAFYTALCCLFQNKNTGQNSFPQLQQLQQLSQHLTQKTSTSSLYSNQQANPAKNLISDNTSTPLYSNQVSQKSSDIYNPSSSDDFQNGSPAPSGRRSPSFATTTSSIGSKPNKTVKKSEKASKVKKSKNKSLTKSKSSLNTRQDSRFNHPQKIIFTPTYEQIKDTTDSNELDSDFNSEEIEASLDDFDLIEAHKRLEIFEDRIIAGKSKYLHPACSVLLEKEETEKSESTGQPIVYTEEEILLSQQYEQENDDYDSYDCQRIPLFWEKRPWDESDDQMDTDENEALKLRITDFNDSFFFGERDSIHAKRRIRHLHHRRHHVNSRESAIDKDENEIIDDEYSNSYEYPYGEDYDDLDSDDINSNSDFNSTDNSDDDRDDEDEDRSGSYHYHFSGASGNYSTGRKQSRRKLQRTKSSPVPRHFNLHQINNDRMSTRKKTNKKMTNEEPPEEVDSFYEFNKKTESFNKKGQAQYGRHLKKSSKGSRASNKLKVPKTSANSSTMYISNLYFETDDSCDETDAEQF